MKYSYINIYILLLYTLILTSIPTIYYVKVYPVTLLRQGLSDRTRLLVSIFLHIYMHICVLYVHLMYVCIHHTNIFYSTHYTSYYTILIIL